MERQMASQVLCFMASFRVAQLRQGGEFVTHKGAREQKMKNKEGILVFCLP